MCKENLDALKDCRSKSDAINLYKKTPDWALSKDFPSIEFLTTEFSNNKQDGFYVGHTFNGEILNEHLVYIFHNCKGTIRVGLNIKKGIIPMLYFANNCEMTICGINTNKIRPDHVPLYIFGENDITAENDINIIFTKYKEEVHHD